MKTVPTFPWLVLICVWTGFGHQPVFDRSTLVVTPGVGIQNLLELGMTPRQIQAKTKDLVARRLQHVGGFAYHVPSLGAQWSQETETTGLYQVSFITNPNMFPAGSMTNWGKPFCGTIAGRLSFQSNNPVNRAHVVAAFGEPSVTYDMRAGLSASVPPALMNQSWRTNTAATAVLTAANSEVLYYPREGIGFGLDHGNVFNFSVYPKAEPPAPANGASRRR